MRASQARYKPLRITRTDIQARPHAANLIKLIYLYIYILYTYILSATNTDDDDDYDDGGDCDDHDDLNDDGDDDSGSYYDGRVDVCYFIIR